MKYLYGYLKEIEIWNILYKSVVKIVRIFLQCKLSDSLEVFNDVWTNYRKVKKEVNFCAQID